MDQIFKKNILILIGIAILIVAIPVSITVVQQSQDLRSKAADETVLTCKGVKPWTEIDNELRVAGYDGAFDHSSTELAAFNRTACPAGGSSGTTSSSTCTPNAFDANKCARCASDGSFWGTNGSDFGPTTGSTQWCSCAQKYASDYSTSGTYATCRGGGGGTGSSTTCTPNAFDANKCARCASDGSFWGTNGSDFGPTTGSTQWCSCAQKYASDYSTSGTYATCRGGGGGTGSSTTCTPNAFDANKCARCASDGSFWGTNGSDFGPTTGSTQLCSCAQ